MNCDWSYAPKLPVHAFIKYKEIINFLLGLYTEKTVDPFLLKKLNLCAGKFTWGIIKMPTIDDIRSRVLAIKSKRDKIYPKLQEFGVVIKETLQDVSISGHSKEKHLGMIGPDDWVYGYLFCNSEKLAIAYRSTYMDIEDSLEHIPVDWRTYSIQELSSAPIEWLESLSSEESLNSLLEDLASQLDDMELPANNYTVIDKMLNSESNLIFKHTTKVLQETDDHNLYGSWLKARNCIQTDPADSITRTCSYLEAVCKKILSDLEQPQPVRRDISSLIAETMKVLNLSPDEQVNDDLKRLLGNVKGIFSAIGSLRTHFGSAHGAAPGSYELNGDHARLLNDIGGALSGFLFTLSKGKT